MIGFVSSYFRDWIHKNRIEDSVSSVSIEKKSVFNLKSYDRDRISQAYNPVKIVYQCKKHKHRCTCVLLTILRIEQSELPARKLELLVYEYLTNKVSYEVYLKYTIRLEEEIKTKSFPKTIIQKGEYGYEEQRRKKDDLFENLYNSCLFNNEEYIELYEQCYGIKKEIKKEKKENKMVKNTMFEKLAKSMMKEVSARIDMTTGTMGITTPEGLATLGTDESGGLCININVMDEIMGFDVPAYAVKTPFDKIAVGDIFVDSNDKQGFVIGITEKSTLQILKPNGQKTTYNATKTNLGANGFFVVTNFFKGMVGGSGGGMNSMLPLMMLMGNDDEGDSKTPKSEGKKNKLGMMLAMSAMSGSEMGIGGINPMMLALMMDKF